MIMCEEYGQNTAAVGDTIRVMAKNISFKLGPLWESMYFKSKLIYWAKQ